MKTRDKRLSESQQEILLRLPEGVTGEIAVEMLGEAGLTHLLAGIGVDGQMTVAFERADHDAGDVQKAVLEAIPGASVIDKTREVLKTSEMSDELREAIEQAQPSDQAAKHIAELYERLQDPQVARATEEALFGKHAPQELRESFDEFLEAAGIETEVEMKAAKRVLIAEAIRVFGSSEKAHAWMSAPLNRLGGVSPIEASDTDDGISAVRDLLNAIEHGIYM